MKGLELVSSRAFSWDILCIITEGRREQNAMKTEQGELPKEGFKRSLASDAADVSGTEDLGEAAVLGDSQILSTVRTSPSLSCLSISGPFLLPLLYVNILQNSILCPSQRLSHSLRSTVISTRWVRNLWFNFPFALWFTFPTAYWNLACCKNNNSKNDS